MKPTCQILPLGTWQVQYNSRYVFSYICLTLLPVSMPSLFHTTTDILPLLHVQLLRMQYNVRQHQCHFLSGRLLLSGRAIKSQSQNLLDCTFNNFHPFIFTTPIFTLPISICAVLFHVEIKVRKP